MPTIETAPTQAPSVPAVELTRVLGTPRTLVYEAWTNPEILRQWFGPATMHCSMAALDVQLGGEYSIGVVPNDPAPGQPEAVVTGNYTRIVPGKLLQFTWKPSWNPGEQSLVTVSFEDATGGTEITIRHTNFDDAAREGYKKGWIGCLDKIEVLLDAPADYARHIEINAPCARVFDAIATPEGVRGWWATNAIGSGKIGGDLSLEFEGHDEPFVMHVDEATEASIQWTSQFNSMLPDWAGTKIVFHLVECTPETCELNFRHIGLTPQLGCYGQCEAGWNRFLPSLVAYAERGEGAPYRAVRPVSQAA